MKKSGLIFVALLTILGCNSTKVGTSAAMPAVPLYPGAEIVTNGENSESIGLSFKVKAPVADVEAFYCKELNTTKSAGAIKGVKNGHQISIIVVDPLNEGITKGTIVEKK